MPKGNGYVFWAVPTGTGSCSVKEQLEILFEKSPWKKEIPLNLEAPIEFINKSADNRSDVPKAMAARNLLAKSPPPDFFGMTPEQALAAEETLVQQSLSHLRSMLD